MLPAASFINVGKSLKEDSAPNQFSSYTYGEASSAMLVDYGGGESKTSFNAKGVLILDGEESKDLTIESVDIDTYNEMYHHLSRKNRLFLFATIILSMTLSGLLHQIYQIRKREKQLARELIKVRVEQEKLLDQSWKKENECPTNESSFELKTCYFNIQTSASLGDCGKNMKNNFLEWYDDTIYEAYSSWWDDFFGKREQENGIKKDEISSLITLFHDKSLNGSTQDDWTWHPDNIFE